MSNDLKIQISEKKKRQYREAFFERCKELKPLDLDSKEFQESKSFDEMGHSERREAIESLKPFVQEITSQLSSITDQTSFLLDSLIELDLTFDDFKREAKQKIRQRWYRQLFRPLYKQYRGLDGYEGYSESELDEIIINDILTLYFAIREENKAQIPNAEMPSLVYNHLKRQIKGAKKDLFLRQLFERKKRLSYELGDEIEYQVCNDFIYLWEGAEKFYLIEQVSDKLGIPKTTLQGWDLKGWISIERIKDYDSFDLDSKWRNGDNLNLRVVAESQLEMLAEKCDQIMNEDFGDYLTTAQAVERYGLGSNGKVHLFRLRKSGDISFTKIRNKIVYLEQDLQRVLG